MAVESNRDPHGANIKLNEGVHMEIISLAKVFLSFSLLLWRCKLNTVRIFHDNTAKYSLSRESRRF